MGDFSHKVTRKNESDSVAETFTNSAERGIVSQTEFFDKEISNPENTRGYYVVKNNDFVYNPRISNLAPCGPVGRNKLNRSGIMSPLYTVFSVKGVDYSFLEFFFKSDHWHLFMYLNGDTGARADRFAIKDKVFFDMPITVPKIHDEQKMIGDFLTDFDLFITLHQRKLDNLKKLKSGLLQKMRLTVETTLTDVFWPLFAIDWEQRKLGDYIHEQRERTTFEDEDRLISCAINGIFLNSELFSHFRGKSNIGYLKIKKNDLILSAQNLHLGNANVNLRFQHGIISPAYKVYSLVDVNPEFMQTWVKREETKSLFLKATTEGASQCRKNIDWDRLYKQSVLFPGFSEQSQIGSFFSQLDNLITLHQRT